ncbi:hypothetical protein TYRP_006904 [Tyrophagus putrescentiae]|nr:hypothetical protein TYRP_006904 [Tyrophagus putrescentiae]
MVVEFKLNSDVKVHRPVESIEDDGFLLLRFQLLEHLIELLFGVQLHSSVPGGQRAINLRAEGGHVAHRVLNRRHGVLQVGEDDAGTLFQDGIGVGEGAGDGRRRVRVQHLLVDGLDVVNGGVLGGDLRLQPFLPLQQQQRLLSASAGQCLSGLLSKGVRFFGEAVHLCLEQLPRGLQLDQRNVRLVDGCFTASSTVTAAADLDDANAVIEGHRLQSGARLRLGHLNDYGEAGLVEWPPGKEGLVQLGGKVVVAQAGARLDGRGGGAGQAFQVALDALHQQVQRLTAEELRLGGDGRQWLLLLRTSRSRSRRSGGRRGVLSTVSTVSSSSIGAGEQTPANGERLQQQRVHRPAEQRAAQGAGVPRHRQLLVGHQRPSALHRREHQDQAVRVGELVAVAAEEGPANVLQGEGDGARLQAPPADGVRPEVHLQVPALGIGVPHAEGTEEDCHSPLIGPAVGQVGPLQKVRLEAMLVKGGGGGGGGGRCDSATQWTLN